MRSSKDDEPEEEILEEMEEIEAVDEYDEHTIIAEKEIREKAEADRKREEDAWQQAQRNDTKAAYERYLRDYPNGRYVIEARSKLRDIEAEEKAEADRKREEDAWQQAQRNDTKAAYERYIRDYPNGKYVGEARSKLRDIESKEKVEADRKREEDAWQQAQRSGTKAAYERYIRDYPNGRYVSEARSKLRDIEAEERRRQEQQAQIRAWETRYGTKVVEVKNPATGKTWMDRNMGAARAATSSTDEQAYGDLYQWGRASDGHQNRNSPTTSSLSSSNTPRHGSFIIAPNSPWDWRSPQNDNLWQGVYGTNNPCPPGYRVPTQAEWNAERISCSSNNAAGAFASPLKLPMAGYRYYYDGSLNSVGTVGYYWSSTINGSAAWSLHFRSSDAYMANYTRAGGRSVRCLKD